MDTACCVLSRVRRCSAARWRQVVTAHRAGDPCPLRWVSTQFTGGLPGLARSLLSSRLKYLERIGVVERLDGVPAKRSEYRLTRSGLALRPVLVALGLDVGLATAAIGNGELSMAALLWDMHQGLDRSRLPKDELTIGFRFPRSNPSSGWIRVSQSESRACTGSPDHPIDLTVIVEPMILKELWWGKRACAGAIAAGDVGFEGPRHSHALTQSGSAPVHSPRSAPQPSKGKGSKEKSLIFQNAVIEPRSRRVHRSPILSVNLGRTSTEVSERPRHFQKHP